MMKNKPTAQFTFFDLLHLMRNVMLTGHQLDCGELMEGDQFAVNAKLSFSCIVTLFQHI